MEKGAGLSKGSMPPSLSFVYKGHLFYDFICTSADHFCTKIFDEGDWLGRSCERGNEVARASKPPLSVIME